MIGLQVDSTAIKLLQRQAQNIGQEPELLKVGGRGLAEKLRSHLSDRDKTQPNKLGGDRTHFYGQARRSVQNPVVTPPSVSVSINHLGIAQRLFGGYIRPVHARLLTIPAAPEAHGKTAREFSNLHFGFAENKYGNLAPALITNLQTRVSFGRKKKDGTRTVTNRGETGGLAMFWLVKQVYQRPDPTVLPTEAELETAARVPMEKYLARKLSSGGAM